MLHIQLKFGAHAEPAKRDTKLKFISNIELNMDVRVWNYYSKLERCEHTKNSCSDCTEGKEIKKIERAERPKLIRMCVLLPGDTRMHQCCLHRILCRNAESIVSITSQFQRAAASSVWRLLKIRSTLENFSRCAKCCRLRIIAMAPAPK